MNMILNFQEELFKKFQNGDGFLFLAEKVAPQLKAISTPSVNSKKISSKIFSVSSKKISVIPNGIDFKVFFLKLEILELRIKLLPQQALMFL